MGRITKYVSGTWILALPLMLLITYGWVAIEDGDGLSSIGYVLLFLIPFVIGSMVITLPSLLIAVASCRLVFRLPATTTERFILILFFFQLAVLLNIILGLAFAGWLVDSDPLDWPVSSLKFFWPAYAAAALAVLIRFKAFIQLTQDLKPVNYETDLV